MSSQEGNASGAPHGSTSLTISSNGDSREHLRVLPPAANWYCSQVCDWGYDERNARWLILYGAKTSICIFEFNPTAAPATNVKPTTLEQALTRPLAVSFVALLQRGKKDGRVTALRCMRDVGGELRVVCAGEEGAVQIWDPMTRTRVDQHRKHTNAEVTALGIRADLDPNWIVSGDRQGGIGLWQRDVSSLQVFTPLPRDAVFAMDVSPQDKTLVAVGYRSGALCIVDLVEKNVRYRLDGHELEVQAVVWAPQAIQETPDAEPQSDFLATASRDRSIKVWAFPCKANDEEQPPEPSLVSRLEVRKPQQASSHSQSTRLWLPLAWTAETMVGNKYGLWSGSFEGNLQLWQWKSIPQGTIKPSLVIKNGHNRLLFGIVSLAASQASTPDQAASSAPVFVTISLDRDLRIWNENLQGKTQELVCIERIPSQGGFTYSLDFNPVRKVLACGVGDQTIRMWNFGAKPLAGGYLSELAWKGLQSKVRCVRWHPMQDNVLAFGTEDGRIGLWDTHAKNSQRLKVNHAGEIRDIVWTIHSPSASSAEASNDTFQEALKALELAQANGENLEDAMAKHGNGTASNGSGEIKIYLWSCDRTGVLCRTDVKTANGVQIRKDCNAFAWDTSSTTIAIGLNSGKVEVFSMSNDVAPAENDHGLARISSFHEHKDGSSSIAWSRGEHSVLLASGSKNGEIIVYENVVPTPSPRQYSPLAGYGQNVVAVFQAHSGAVNALRWSIGPDGEDLLASCGDDGLVRIWDILARTVRSTFSHHIGRVLSITWISPTILSSGGQDQSIRIWDFQDHIGNGNAQAFSTTVNLQTQKLQRKIQPANLPQSEAPRPVEASPRPRVKKSSDRRDSMFQTKDPDWIFAINLSSDSKEAPSSPTNAREKNRTGIILERTRLEQDCKWDEAAQLYLLEGRIVEALYLVASHEALTSEWVAYAPMAGQDVWREISHLFATQLCRSGKFKRAALQYLSVGKVESAINCLANSTMYAEAISLGISRLGSNHELVKNTLWKYAEWLERKKKMREAAAAFLSHGSTDATTRAISLLSSLGNVEDAKRAMSVWIQVSEGPLDRPTIPTSTWLSIARLAVAHIEFELAAQSIKYLLSGQTLESPESVSLLPSTTVLHKLSLITLSLAAHLAAEQIPTASSAITISQDGTTNEIDQFIGYLQHPSPLAWEASIGAPLTKYAVDSTVGGFWSLALTTCRENGLWFENATLIAYEVVEHLGDSALFDFLLPTAGQSEVDQDCKPKLMMSVARLVVKILAELMSGYLLSALEALRDVLLVLTSSCEDQLGIVIPIFPGGFVDSSAPPKFGEFADEEEDSKALWAECFLLQCELFIRHLSHNPDNIHERLQFLAPLVVAVEASPASTATIKSHAQRVESSMQEALSRNQTALAQANGSRQGDSIVEAVAIQAE